MKLKLIVILFISGAMACYAANKDLIASWSFNSAKNGMIKDNVGNCDAVLGKNINTSKIFKKGLFGNAIQMHGAKNMLVFKHDDRLSLIDNFTIKCVFKADKINDYRVLLWKGDRNIKPHRINYCVSLHDGKIEFKFKNATDKWFSCVSKKPVVEVNKWYQLVITFAKGRMTLYLNGKKIYTRLYKPAKLYPNNDPFYIGAGQNWNGAVAFSFNGLIDEVVIMKGIHPPSIAENQKLKKLIEGFSATLNEQGKSSRKKIIDEILADSATKKSSLQAMTLKKLKSLLTKCRYNKFFKLNSNNKALIALTLNTSKRIVSPDDIANGKIKASRTINLSAAKNEYEGFQIILLGNPNKEIRNIKIKLNSLTSKNGKTAIPANQLEWGYIKTICSETPQYDVDFVGEIPDAIMEGQSKSVNVKSSWFTPVYIRIKVKGTVPAGTYKGKVAISYGDEICYTNINLKVYDFKLPVTTSLKIAFSFFESFYRKWYDYGKLNDKQKMYIYDFLLKYRISPNNIYARNIYPELRFMEKLKAKGANLCFLGYLNQSKPVSEQQLSEIIAKYRKRIEQVRSAGFDNMAYLYAFDEIKANKKNLPYAKKILARFKKEFPNIEIIQTSSPLKGVLQYFDIWVPLFNYFSKHTKEIKQCRKDGKKFWWYAADPPNKPYPNFFLDYPVFDERIIMTLSYMYKIKGVLYWCINREWSTNYDIKKNWPGKRWKPYIINMVTKKRQYKNGMGNFVYPGKNGQLLPSLRLENLRDGIEDYEYLMILKKLVVKMKKNQGDTTLLKQAEKLLKVPSNVAVAVDSYSANPENLMKYRNKIALMIEKLKRNTK